MNGSWQVNLNGSEVWANVIELDDGLRLRLDLSDWERLPVSVGQRVPVRLPGRGDEMMFVTHATEVPPVVWVILAKRVRAAG